ncbi:MAG: amidohydrolase family protein, partial [Gemmatimonadaceae bacterium]|nr:amidohydrolase family protein [Gemmatimonadaceae bacterium]
YRSAWIGAERYRRQWDRWLEKREGEPPARNLNDETLAEVLRGNVGMVFAAGARSIVHSDDPSYSQRMNQEAAKSMAAARALGLAVSDEEAIRWITINPAWAMGLEDRIGSLEPGKNADVVLWSGHPFSVYTRADQVWIDGALMYDRKDPSKQWRTDFELGYGPGRTP